MTYRLSLNCLIVFHISLMVSCHHKQDSDKTVSSSDSITIIAKPIFNEKVDGDKMLYVKKFEDNFLGKAYKEYPVSTFIKDSFLIIKTRSDFPYMDNLLHWLSETREIRFYLTPAFTPEQKRIFDSSLNKSALNDLREKGDSFVVAGVYSEHDTALINKWLKENIYSNSVFNGYSFQWGTKNIFKKDVCCHQLFFLQKPSDSVAQMNNQNIDSVSARFTGGEDNAITVYLTKASTPLFNEFIKEASGKGIAISMDNEVFFSSPIAKPFEIKDNKFKITIPNNTMELNIIYGKIGLKKLPFRMEIQ
jgi:hypothetical protein